MPGPKRNKSYSRATTSDKKPNDYLNLSVNKDDEKLKADNTSDEENRAIEELEKKADKILKTVIETEDKEKK